MALPIQQQQVSATVSSANANQVKDTSRTTLNVLVGKVADDLATQSTSVITGLDAIIAALAAKPSA